MYQLSMVLND